MRGMARGMIDLLMGYMADCCIHTRITAVEVAIVARKVTAGDLNANTVICVFFRTKSRIDKGLGTFVIGVSNPYLWFMG